MSNFGSSRRAAFHGLAATAGALNGVTTETTGSASGDFNSRYRVKATTRISASAGPPGRERRSIMDNRLLGPCPANRKPGDLAPPNGQVMSMATEK